LTRSPSDLSPPSPAPAVAASRICARFSLRTACLPPLSSVVSSSRSASLSSTRYRIFILISSRGGQTSRTMSQKSGTARRIGPHRFTEKQGQYLAFIYVYNRMFGQAPAHADMQRHFRVTPPSVHQMVLGLDRDGFIRRRPGVARSIDILGPTP